MKEYSPFQKDDIYFVCEECDALYPSKEVAAECEVWCREHAEQNPDIIKKSIPVEKDER